ncbi:hypothetical protein Gpo141_00013671, partial [Globisporangium polare]
MLRGNNPVAALVSVEAVNILNGLVALAANATTPGDAGPPREETLRAAVQSARVQLVFFLMAFAVIWLLCVALVIHVRYNRAAAFKGDDTAARKIILPAFEPLLVVLGVFNLSFVLFMAITLLTGFYDKVVPPVVLESIY